ncbi:hypothetical protein JWG39_09225 [Desulforhopalus vacuolatus]|uniref:hypothetical protein n=1 Tax=Desulforhopalus vacuolatus TaxID=40414 RepID=UPI001965DFEE|nr:hypothetical protein [Desulforhopalus vacuolatus]MBM9519997.1 hypothetical protein [Desulforhopalus vacuolatus]
MKILNVILMVCILSPLCTRVAQAEDTMKDAVTLKSMYITERESGYILQTAYPLAGIFGELVYRNAILVSSKDNGSGYAVTTKLNYLNLLDQYQYVKITFYYDYQGNGDDWEFSGHSDIIAPRQLTVTTLLQFLKNANSQ